MQLSVTTLTERYARQLCAWHYEAPYAIYNFPDWETVIREKLELSDASARAAGFRAVTSEGGLIGFFRMTPDKKGGVALSLGLAPDDCNKGLSAEFVPLVTQYTRTIHPGKPLYLEVRTFNLRAVRCFETCGFRALCKHREQTKDGEVDFYKLEYMP